MYSIKKGCSIVLFICLLVVIFSCITTQESAISGEGKVKETVQTIILKKEPAGISVNPLRVKLGTTIVWFNSDPEPVTIKFIDKLGIACKVPVNFYADLFGYYETGPIAQGGTASICFIFAGTFTYDVKRIVKNDKGEDTEVISQGKIIATEP